MDRFLRGFRLVLLLATVTLLAQCSLEEDFRRDPGTRVGFSADTLSFDTVFTALGSATRSFKILNPYDRPLSLASVRVESNNGGRFRINVDGLSGEEVKDVFVGPNDSIYVFAEVTVDPDQEVTVSPFILEGRVVVRAVDEEQSVLLIAFGQNANYLPRSRARGGLSYLSCELGTETLDDPKPYVLYGSLVVDSCTLVLPAGCKLYIHGGIVASDIFGDSLLYNDGILFFINRGRLVIDGSAENPVLIASARTEERFLQRAGQYSGIRLSSTVGRHSIRHARIRNGSLGILVDSAAKLDISHTELSYISTNGLVGYAAEINADNVLIHSTGGEGFAAVKGGRYTLDYCTITNYSGRNPAVTLSLGVKRPDNINLVGLLDARIRNSIFYSSSRDALSLPDFDRPELRTYTITNSIIRVEELPRVLPDFGMRCVDCIYPKPTDRLFLNASQDSFQLDSMSIALSRARTIPELPLDLPGVLRKVDLPDIGAYEFTPR